MNGKRTDLQAQQASEQEILEGVRRHLAGVEALVPDAPAWRGSSSSSQVGGRVHVRSRVQFALAPWPWSVLVVLGDRRRVPAVGPGGPTERPSAAQPRRAFFRLRRAGVAVRCKRRCRRPGSGNVLPRAEVGAVTRSGSGMVGVILPDATTSARYTSYDRRTGPGLQDRGYPRTSSGSTTPRTPAVKSRSPKRTSTTARRF